MKHLEEQDIDWRQDDTEKER